MVTQIMGSIASNFYPRMLTGNLGTPKLLICSTPSHRRLFRPEEALVLGLFRQLRGSRVSMSRSEGLTLPEGGRPEVAKHRRLHSERFARDSALGGLQGR